MAYVFPYEDAFILGVSCLILVLLYVRWRVARRQQARAPEEKHSGDE
ncbi:MAG: hypothetical protein MRJ96_14190 [Nitrospirales bacterium]|nr:hypothetical protein [Nitrospira sp.]MDR4502593.1 hypothetical protein [Nitrospirales bacterium]